ncbi:unnamed protein product [Linum tenue]|uniref:Protein JASON n=1 Tax=Linum tenue TaxID=586396 RepID=A0AAV0MTX4_9ROSI|nr:unnamed protein product [Linum tenue]
MICALPLQPEIGSICRTLLGYLDLSVSRAMACFFDCFRVKDDGLGSAGHQNPQLVSPARSARPTEAMASKNRLSALFLSEEEEDSPATSGNKGNLSWVSPQTQKELRDEARFLKACGTLPETPVEFRKASEKLKSSPPVDDSSDQSEFHSWLPNTSNKKLLADMPTDESSTPIKSCEELARCSISSDQAPSSCISHAQNGARNSSVDNSGGASVKTVMKLHEQETDDASSASPFPSATNTQLRNKSVRFECDFDTASSKGSSSSGSGGQIIKDLERFGDVSVTKPSTRPTPLKLSSEMQTPGTVYPTNAATSGYGKARVRSQYVCSVLQPVENVSQWQELKEDHANYQLWESVEQSESATPSREAGVGATSPSKDLKLEASLSTWLKPVSQTFNQKGDSLDAGTVVSKKFHIRETPGDRPIIGMVAAHWNEEEPTEISPKWWDGNGIPNSTNKYKEDQKVSWHATPFEERLEKALSEESLVAQKKPVIGGSPLAFDECEESDTAFSQLPATSNSKSVVSY